MKIYSMTATFGKLAHETLTLKPGLNIMEAPNEWGKSTWCAFLESMLYGIDTREKTTKTSLAAKERYAPWSGAPMAGRMELEWNGRNITIERRTKGRLIFGEFQAYETDTGIEIPELNGVNCGQMLLGVERSVFTRAGFLKLSDLPVTQDDSLRRRLNNLVTTGDESGDGDKLAQTLKDLKNKCRYNRSGLLPQAENEREQLRNQLSDLHDLQVKAETIRTQQGQLEDKITQLKNHRDALQYADSLDKAAQVDTALVAQQQAQDALTRQQTLCDGLPARKDAVQKLQDAEKLQAELLAVQMEAGNLPVRPIQPDIPDYFKGVAAAEADFDRYQKRCSKHRKNMLIWNVIFLVSAVLSLGLLIAGLIVDLPVLYFRGVALIAGMTAVRLATGIASSKKYRRDVDALFAAYPGLSPDRWVPEAQQQEVRQQAYQQAWTSYESAVSDHNSRRNAVDAEISALTGGEALSQSMDAWKQAVSAWDALDAAQKELQMAQKHADALQSMVKPVAPPKELDVLTFSMADTERMLSDAQFMQRQLQLNLGQCMGQAESLGQESLLKARLDTLNRRIARLEDMYYALEMAQDTLREATTALQRRFAPRISKRAQELFGKLTGGRYQRITLSEDLSLNASAENEDTLRSSQWRSDGTVDQLYLALRLAVAEELTPEAPLILDDALVRFDDTRLKAALDILKDAAEHKQVILFTCQSRETELSAQ